MLLGGRVGEVGLLGLTRRKVRNRHTALRRNREGASARARCIPANPRCRPRHDGQRRDAGLERILRRLHVKHRCGRNPQRCSTRHSRRWSATSSRKRSASLRPELYARITEKLVFNRLSYDVQMEIARFHIARELSFLRDKGFHLIAGPQVISFVMQRGFHPRLGARPLRDAIEKHLRGAIADATLAEVRSSTLEFVVCANELVVRPSEPNTRSAPVP